MAGDAQYFSTPEEFQTEIDQWADGEEIDLHGFEYPGPIVIRKAITLDGHGATLWALNGPACRIEGQGVSLKNFRVEVTHTDLSNIDEDKGCALQVKGDSGVLLDNLEVRGSVQGLPAEDGQWRYPFSLKLGDILHGHAHRFLLRLFVPVPCKIVSAGIYGIKVTPAMLSPGRNEVVLHIDDSLNRDALLLGTIYLQTAFLKRQISICGHVISSEQGHRVRKDGEILYEPTDWDHLESSQTTKEPSIPVQKPSVRQPPPPPITPAPEPKKVIQPSTAPTPPAAVTEAAPDLDVGTTKHIDQQSGSNFHKPFPDSISTRIVSKPVSLSGIFCAPPTVEIDAGSFEPKAALSAVFGASIPIRNPDNVLLEQPVAEGAASLDPARFLSQSDRNMIHGGSKSIPISAVFGFGAEPVKPADHNTEVKKTPKPEAESPPPAPKNKPPKKPDSVPNIFLS